MSEAVAAPTRKTHPVVWTILYIPFGALGGFVTVGLMHLANGHDLSITQGALLGAAQMLSQWLKWLWAPAVDITLTPKRWYVISTACSALGVIGMATVPLGPKTLPLLLVVIALASLINSIVGMAVEAMIASLIPPEEIGRVSAWFQAGNLGGNGVGGGLGLVLLTHFSTHTWVAGLIMGALFMACCVALPWLPDVTPHASGLRPGAAVKKVAVDLWAMVRTRVGFLSALICVLPVATGAAQGNGILTQGDVMAYWHAGEREAALVQGFLVGIVTAIGCFPGGWLCDRLNPRAAYMVFGLFLVAVATGMALSPATVTMYISWNLVYAFGTGLAYAGFSAVALSALGSGPAATGYNTFASLSNFPIWWLGPLLGWMADPTKGAHHGPVAMLLLEAALGVAGVLVFAATSKASGQSLLARRASAVAPTA